MASNRVAGICGWLFIAAVGCGGRQPLDLPPTGASTGNGAAGGASTGSGGSVGGASTGSGGSVGGASTGSGGSVFVSPTGSGGSPTGSAGAPTGSGGSPTGSAGASTGSGGSVGAAGVAGGMSGPWLFFDSLQGLNRDVYAVQADGSSLKRITTSAATEREPAVSPDGKTLAYSSDESGSFQIRRVARGDLMPLPTGPERQLTNDVQGAEQPSWSPDGQHLAYHNDGGVFGSSTPPVKARALSWGWTAPRRRTSTRSSRRAATP